jgi:hypothetical protein
MLQHPDSAEYPILYSNIRDFAVNEWICMAVAKIVAMFMHVEGAS